MTTRGGHRVQYSFQVKCKSFACCAMLCGCMIVFYAFRLTVLPLFLFNALQNTVATFFEYRFAKGSRRQLILVLYFYRAVIMSLIGAKLLTRCALIARSLPRGGPLLQISPKQGRTILINIEY